MIGKPCVECMDIWKGSSRFDICWAQSCVRHKASVIHSYYINLYFFIIEFNNPFKNQFPYQCTHSSLSLSLSLSDSNYQISSEVLRGKTRQIHTFDGHCTHHTWGVRKG